MPQNPVDPEYQEYLDYIEYQKYLGEQPQAMKPKSAAEQYKDMSLWDKAKDVGNAFIGNPSTFAQAGAEQEAANPNPSPVEGAAPLAVPAAAMPKAAMTLVDFLGKTAPRRVLTSAAMGAAQNPENPLKGAAIAGGFSTAGEGLGALLRKTGDVGMQVSVGRRKYTPGVGETLADEGLIGTERAVKGQVNRKLGERAAQMQEIGARVPGRPINAERMGQEIAAESAAPMGLGKVASPSQADIPKLQKIAEFSKDVMNRGDESVSQGLARRAAGGTRAYAGKEDPMQNLLAKLSKLEQMKYSQRIKEVAPDIIPVDKAFGALKRAQSGLEAEATLPRSLFGALSTGYTSIPASTLVGTTASQLATKAGQTLPAASFLAGQGLADGELAEALRSRKK